MKQLSVFIENRLGSLQEFTELLLKDNINILVLSLAESEDYGIARLIVKEPEAVADFLKEKGYSVTLTDVLCVEAKDHPGALNEVAKTLAEHDITITYVYGFVDDGQSRVVLKTSDMEKTFEIIKEKGL